MGENANPKWRPRIVDLQWSLNVVCILYVCIYVYVCHFSEPSVAALWLVVLCSYYLCSDITGMQIHVILTYQLAKE